MNPLDNVERRDSDPHAHANLVAPDHDTQEIYERHLNAVCQAIRSTHPALVDSNFLVQVLSTLANKVIHADVNMHRFVEALDILSDQIEDL